MGQQNMRGSGDFAAAVDCQIEIKKENKYRFKVIQHKLRCEFEIDPFHIDVMRKNYKSKFIFSGKAEIIDKYVIAKKEILKILKKGEMAQIQIEKHLKDNLNIGRNKVIDCLAELKSRKKIVNRSGAKNKNYYSIKK